MEACAQKLEGQISPEFLQCQIEVGTVGTGNCPTIADARHDLRRLRANNQRWRVYDRFLINENRWRAQRYAVSEGLIDFGRAAVVPLPELVDELIYLVAEDAEALGCMAESARLRDLSLKTSADRQRKVYSGTCAASGSHDAARRSVVQHLMEEFHADL